MFAANTAPHVPRAMLPFLTRSTSVGVYLWSEASSDGWTLPVFYSSLTSCCPNAYGSPPVFGVRLPIVASAGWQAIEGGQVASLLEHPGVP